MELTTFLMYYQPTTSAQGFMESYYRLKMNYLASDLLNQGLSPSQISDAVEKAINAARVSGLLLRQHFAQVYSAINSEIISDCKLSPLGYGLVLMNANVNLRVVGDFQLSVLTHFLKKDEASTNFQ